MCKLKHILNAISKYCGIYLTYQIAICFNVGVSFDELVCKCWFSLIQIPDSIDQIAADLFADIGIGGTLNRHTWWGIYFKQKAHIYASVLFKKTSAFATLHTAHITHVNKCTWIIVQHFEQQPALKGG